MLWITLVLFIFGEAVAQKESNGPCPTLQAVKDFNVPGFSRKWFEFAKYADKTKIKTKCVTATYAQSGSDSYDVTYTETPLDGGATYTTSFKAMPADNSKHGLFRITPSGTLYSILATDYDNWAFVWSCTFNGDKSIRNARILTRARYPKKWVIDAAYQTVDDYKLPRSNFIATIKTRCPRSYFMPGK